MATALDRPNYHTSTRSSKIPRTALRLQVKFERTYRHKKETNRLKNQRDQLVEWGKNPHQSIDDKLFIYKAAVEPIWSYGIELWGCASKSNIVIIRRSQSKILRAIANAPQYVTNHNLHTAFSIPYVSEVIHERINKHHNNLEAHPNLLLEPQLQPINIRRLKIFWPLDLRTTDVTSLDEYPTRHSNTLYRSVLCIIFT
jgi:hypothetical protein